MSSTYSQIHLQTEKEERKKGATGKERKKKIATRKEEVNEKNEDRKKDFVASAVPQRKTKRIKVVVVSSSFSSPSSFVVISLKRLGFFF